MILNHKKYMIPKKIHYCWFGKAQKNKVFWQCLESWKKYAPDFEIKEWNEENFDATTHPFAARMRREKHWAFVSDYARLAILEKEGGIYLDTDMLIVQSLRPMLNTDCFLGEEEPGIISAGIIGAAANHPFIGACKKYYDCHPENRTTIPRILTKIFLGYENKKSIAVYPPKTFYPFSAKEIKNYRGQNLPPETYGVHLWSYSWGHPLNKLFKKFGIYESGKKISEKLGIKKILKKIFNFV